MWQRCERLCFWPQWFIPFLGVSNWTDSPGWVEEPVVTPARWPGSAIGWRCLARTFKCILAGFSHSASTNHLIPPVKWIDDWFLLFCAFSLASCPLIGEESVVWTAWDSSGYNPSCRCYAWICLTSLNPFHGTRQMIIICLSNQIWHFWNEITLIWLPASSERESVVLSAPNGDCPHHWLEVSCDGKSIFIMDWYMDSAAQDDADRWIKWAFGRLMGAKRWTDSFPSKEKSAGRSLSRR